MTTTHLNDSAIQSFALDKSNCSQEIINHIMTCDDCRAKAASYQSLFTILKTEEAPVFDFDLASVVVSRLPVAHSKTSAENKFIYLLLVLSLLALILPLYFFWAYVQRIFTGAVPAVISLGLTAAIVFLIFQSIEMFRKYRRKMLELNIY